MTLFGPLHAFILIPILVLCGSCVVGLGMTWNLYSHLDCWYFGECCGVDFTKFQPDELENSLNTQVYGQHLATQTILGALKGHLLESSPKKALVFSFNGWSGTGKSWVADLIADNMFVKKRQSRFRHLYVGSRDFHRVDMVKTYQDTLRREVMAAVKECPQSLFIFDQVDQIPPGVLDALASFLDIHEEVDGIDYRQAVYIFLSNTGGAALAEVAVKFWTEGLKREDIKLTDLEHYVASAVYSSAGGLQKSYIVEKNLIDFYIPFFPLEQEHVELCIRQELKRTNMSCTDDFIGCIVKNINYFPADLQVYSVPGCKSLYYRLQLPCSNFTCWQ